MQASRQLNDDRKSLLILAAVCLSLWLVPGLSLLLLPIQYLDTHVHEMSHAMASLASGGAVSHIDVFANGSGVTLASGNPWLINPAGYLGAALLGGALILCCRSERSARFGLRVLALALTLSLILWVRGDLVGLVSIAAWILALFAGSATLGGRQVVLLGQFVGIQQCIASIQALYVLLKVSSFTSMQSDAQNMAQATGVPALLWALLWGAIGVGILFATLRAAWNRSAGSPRSRG